MAPDDCTMINQSSWQSFSKQCSTCPEIISRLENQFQSSSACQASAQGRARPVRQALSYQIGSPSALLLAVFTHPYQQQVSANKAAIKDAASPPPGAGPRARGWMSMKACQIVKLPSMLPICLCVERSTWTLERRGSIQQLLRCPTTSSSSYGRTAPTLLPGRSVPIPPPLFPRGKLTGFRDHRYSPCCQLLSAYYKNAAHSLASASVRRCNVGLIFRARFMPVFAATIWSCTSGICKTGQTGQTGTSLNESEILKPSEAF